MCTFVQTTNAINMRHSKIENPTEKIEMGRERETTQHGPQLKSFRIVKVVKIVVEQINETVAHNQMTYTGYNFISWYKNVHFMRKCYK